MKILYHHRTFADGAEGIHIFEIINAFQKAGHQVILLGAKPQIENRAKLNNKRKNFSIIYWLRWHLPDTFYEIAQIILGAVNYFKVAKVIRREKPDLVYKRHSNYDFGPVLAAKHLKVPIFLEANSSYSSKEIIKFEKIHFIRLTRFFERLIFNNSSYIFVISSSLKKKLEILKINPDKIIVTPNGANLEKFYPRLKNPDLLKKYQLQNRFVIGFVGIPRAWHGVEFLLNSFRKIKKAIPQACLLFVGSEPTPDLKHNNDIVFTGRVSHERIADYIALFDIAVLPAEYRLHASPMKIPEYMAMGKVVLAPNLENIRDLITNEKDGLLFTQDSVDDFTRKIIDLYNDPEKMKYLAQNAVRTTNSRLNWDSIVQIILENYAKINSIRR